MFTPLGRAIADLSAHYQPAELAAIASYLAGLTDILREQTTRLNEEAATAGPPIALTTPAGPG